MPMPRFNYHQPQNLEQALDMVGMYRTNGKILAGGTDLVPKLRAGLADVQHVVSLNRVPGLNRITYQEDDGLVIGSGARLSDVAANPEVRKHYPGLAHACSVMATTQIRNMATVAGNIVNAAPSADTAAPLLAYDAAVILVERGGRRHVPLTEFFTGPGMNIMEPMEIMEAIRVPSPPQRSGSCYMRLSARSKVDIAGVGVAGFLALDMDGGIIKCRLALSSVAPTPVRCPEAEAMLDGQKPETELLMRAAASCVRSSRPIDDVRATANYRRKMVQVLAGRVIQECYEMAKGGAS
jgi:CO/xanthine dehydrogenase FAD-binding subunit